MLIGVSFSFLPLRGGDFVGFFSKIYVSAKYMLMWGNQRLGKVHGVEISLG